MAIKKTDFLKFGDNLYEIIPPIASEEERGGIIASPKTDNETAEVKIGTDGKLYAPVTNVDFTEINHNIENLQEQIDGHISDDVNHITTDERIKWNTAKIHADSTHIAQSDIDSSISTHNTSTTAHNDIRLLIGNIVAKLNNFLDVDDTTVDQLSEVLELINNNKGTLESLTTNKVNVFDIVDNLTTAMSDKVLSANQGVIIKGLIDLLENEVSSKANAVHMHEISDVNNLQDTLDTINESLKNISGSDHNHDDVYYTQEQVDNMVFITVDDIDEICGTIIEGSMPEGDINELLGKLEV